MKLEPVISPRKQENKNKNNQRAQVLEYPRKLHLIAMQSHNLDNSFKQSSNKTAQI